MNGNERIQRQRRFDRIKHLIRKGEGLFEVLTLTLAYFYIWRIFYRNPELHAYYGNGKFVLAGIYALLVYILFLYCDSFKYGQLKLSDVLISQWISILFVNFITYFQVSLTANRLISPYPMLILTLMDGMITFILVYLYTVIYHRLYISRHMVMIYGNENAISLKRKMDTRSDQYLIERLLPIDLGLDAICQELIKYDAVVINDVPAQIRNDILKFCYQRQIRAYVTPKISDIIARGATDITLFDTPLLLIKGNGLSLEQRFIKRLMDIVICLIAMVVAAPIILVVSAAIKIEDRGPIFYRQERVTKDHKTFNILKFRSMIVDAEKDGKPHPATDNDPRITKVGRVIRAMRIDELPQILNILRGDMSWVGPRPERTEHVEEYTRLIPEFSYREQVKGGLTGYAQVYGKYNTSAYDKLRLDLIYIENYSLLLDIKLLLMTIRVMFKKDATEGYDEDNIDIYSDSSSNKNE